MNSLQTELHCFCDSSNQAYAAVAYVKLSFEHSTETHFVLAKSRLVPTSKKQVVNQEPPTIPRLELMALVLGARMTKFIQSGLPETIILSRIVLWTDSQAILGWFKNPKPKSVFVENRIRELRQDVYHQYEFRYISTDQNPADLGTREMLTMNFRVVVQSSGR